jgi:uncharacterized protein (DUF2252 family)
MAVAKLAELPLFDLSRKTAPWELRREEGKAMRATVPREAHAEWQQRVNRPDPVKLVVATNKGRQANLIPLRMGRMAASPFAFLRGSACVMASDLSVTPITGVSTIMDGDAHLNNFGLYGTAQRELVFDLNDFDEATVGPWEWDLKRLAASINVAGRQNGLNRRERATAVKRAVEAYRDNARRLQDMGVLDIWYLHAYPGKNNPIVKADPKSQAVIDKVMAKAMHTDNHSLLPKVAERQPDGMWRFRDDPPVLTKIDPALKEKVVKALNQYSLTLSRERRIMLGRYNVHDVAHRVVGVGSVGTRAYLVLLFGNGDGDPLFLQVKEAVAAAHAPFVPPLVDEFRHNGKRVITGQRALQASSDPMLGYTQIDGRTYYVRQMKNLKASIPVEWLTGSSFNFYSAACGAILARAHARTGDPARISGYCGNCDVLDDALATWAESYGDQTERDHAALVAAIHRGEVKADLSEGGTGE